MLHNSRVQPDFLPAIAALAEVARLGSFTRAAAVLGVSPSALSQTVRKLEQRLGVRLLERSTRRVVPTEAGRQFLASAGPALAALDAAVDELDQVRSEPEGLVRLNLSQVAAQCRVLPVLAAFEARHPRITVELHCDNRLVDLAEGRFDAGIRLGESLSRDMIAVPLGGPVQGAAFASPDYLRRHPAPTTPADLARHRCLNFRMSTGALYRWEFAREGRIFDIQVDGPVITNDARMILAAARSGLGIGGLLDVEVQADFDQGSLVPVLEPWWASFAGFHLYYPSRTELPRRLRLLIDFLRTAWPAPGTGGPYPATMTSGPRHPGRPAFPPEDPVDE